MIKKTISYTNPFTGETETEDLYFNLTKVELLEMSMTAEDGDFATQLRKIAEEKNNLKIYQAFKEIILKAYGKRSDDGKRFIKTPEVTEEFTQTEAFSEFIFTLLQDSEFAAQFVNGLMPADLMRQVQDEQRAKPQDFQKPKVPLSVLNGGK